MLPAPADFVAQHVDRARREVEAEHLAALVRGIAAKAHAAAPGEGEADHDAELADVAVPAELRARAILGDEGMLESAFGEPDELSDFRSQGQQERRNLGRGTELVPLEVVARAVAYGSALRGKGLVL